MIRMSFSETIFLFFLALIIFGPKKLPEIARQVGKYMNEFRRASNEFKAQIEQEIAHLEVENNKQTILPPNPPVMGATSRTLEASATEAAYAQAARASDAPPSGRGSIPAAEEDEPLFAANAAPPASQTAETAERPNSVTSPASQESHA